MFVEILKAIAQGIVQGVTEWLPVSSTGHILLLDAIWQMKASLENPAFFDVFKVVIQLGSILAVVLLYFRTLNPFAPSKAASEKKSTWDLWLKIVIASVPAGIVGLALETDFVKEHFFDLDRFELSFVGRAVIAAALIVYGVAFLFMEKGRKSASHDLRAQSLTEITYGRAFGIGCFQILALIPGTSRSGSTILGATLLGVSRPIAAEFSFFMAIPVMLGASGLKVLKYFLLDGYSFGASEWILLTVATVMSFLVSLVVIRFLMSYIRKHSFQVFGWYRIALGAVILLVLILAPQVLVK